MFLIRCDVRYMLCIQWGGQCWNGLKKWTSTASITESQERDRETREMEAGWFGVDDFGNTAILRSMSNDANGRHIM